MHVDSSNIVLLGNIAAIIDSFLKEHVDAAAVAWHDLTLQERERVPSPGWLVHAAFTNCDNLTIICHKATDRHGSKLNSAASIS